MPILANSRHERFAQAVAAGHSASDAYEAAGYTPSRHHASRLATNGNVKARIAELQGKATERTIFDLQWLLDKAEEARAGAMQAKQHSAAVAAIREIGTLTGLRVEKREQKEIDEFTGMTADQMRQNIAQSLGIDDESLAEARRIKRERMHPGRTH